ncbi:uncharacterized protein N7511_001569 [Penicillium nucicola]|uniref:uncharacterized protein n=1 Tax=Penicillium nucicola TaxID=1850975 RepID=UPI002544F452|nr:uncharacterized protein N7511_001569 [Penicillium nucicola]KAJ5776558.1 hypothetical protein N7511_001569 [Penicillium nucicola]
MSNLSKRQRRSRVACEPCRDRKRKCDGHQPCETCREFEYECYYDISARKKRNKNHFLNTASTTPAQALQQASPLLETPPSPRAETPDEFDTAIPPQSLESNSGAAFVRGLALKIDPVNAPEPQFFAWNLGVRQLPGTFGSLDIIDIISKDDLVMLARVYFEKVDTYYGFIDQETFFGYLDSRWSSQTTVTPYDAVLCGVAAIGYLFTRKKPVAAELHLAESARTTLEQFSMSGIPSLALITGWALRLFYLRFTSTPHIAWMASCSVLHLIEASGLHVESPSRLLLGGRPRVVDANIRRRLVGFAQYINTWVSFDLGRSRISLHDMSYVAPNSREGDYTVEMLNLLPISESLESHKPLDGDQIRTMLLNQFETAHTQPPLVLSQCNLILCLFRRLRALHCTLSGELKDKIYTFIRRSLSCARELAHSGCSWPHVASVPFQVVCTLLAIDTTESLSRLAEAMNTLKSVMDSYETEVMKEAYRIAGLLISLQQKRKDNDAKILNGIVGVHVDPQSQPRKESLAEGFSDIQNLEFLNGLEGEMPNLDELDFTQFFMAHHSESMLGTTSYI